MYFFIYFHLFLFIFIYFDLFLFVFINFNLFLINFIISLSTNIITGLKK